MSCDVEIKIFGKVSDPEAIWELAGTAAAEGKINWLSSFGRAEFPGLLEQAAREGRALILTKRDTSDFFEDVTASCQEAGLSYVVAFGETGSEDFTNGFAWHPGMNEEFQFILDGKYPALKLVDVQKAAIQGIDAVNSLLARVADHTRVGKIEIAPGFAEAYRLFDEGGETAEPSMSGARP